MSHLTSVYSTKGKWSSGSTSVEFGLGHLNHWPWLQRWTIHQSELEGIFETQKLTEFGSNMRWRKPHPRTFNRTISRLHPPGYLKLLGSWESRHVRFKGAQEVLCQSGTETNAWHINEKLRWTATPVNFQRPQASLWNFLELAVSPQIAYIL